MEQAAARFPDHITVRGARVHNLKNVDVDIPLNRIVGIAMWVKSLSIIDIF